MNTLDTGSKNRFSSYLGYFLILDKLYLISLNLRFLIFKNKNTHSTYLLGLLQRLNELMYMNHLSTGPGTLNMLN